MILKGGLEMSRTRRVNLTRVRNWNMHDKIVALTSLDVFHKVSRNVELTDMFGQMNRFPTLTEYNFRKLEL